MRRLHVAVLVGMLMLFGAAAAAQEEQAATLKTIQKELRELHEAVVELTLRVEKLEEGDPEEEDDELPGFTGFDDPNWESRGPDRKALRKIKLPEDPTEDQVREYINKILRASDKQNSFSSEDPQVSMLARVSSENLPLLVEALQRNRRHDYYLAPAINRLAEEEHKEMILEALPLAHGLVEVIVAKGWEEDARDVLIEELRAGAQYLPTEWIDAVAGLGDPSTYEDLKEHFIHSSNRSWTYRAISELPGIELEDAVAEAWNRARRRHAWERNSMAQVAVEYGHLDAFQTLVEAYDDPDTDSHTRSEIRRAIARHCGIRGSAQEMLDWFEENQDKLVWDAEKKKFVVKETEQQNPQP